MDSEYEKIVDDLFGLATSGVPDTRARYVLGSVDQYKTEPVNWLWEGYLLRGRLALLDARHSSGKSRLVIAIAAAGSLGVLPFTQSSPDAPVKVDKFRTLYIGSEDDEGDIRLAFEEAGGDVKYLVPYNPATKGALQFSDEGLEQLESMIKVNEISYVVVDPALDFMPKDVKQNDNSALTPYFAKLAAIARRTNVCLQQARHWSQGTKGKELHQLGAGGESWVYKARSHLVIFPHRKSQTKTYFQSLVVPSRATIRTTLGRPFGVEINEGRQRFISPDDVDVQSYVDSYEVLGEFLNMKRIETRGAPEKLSMICEWLVQKLTNGPLLSEPLLDQCKLELNVSRATIFNARKEMGVKAYQSGKQWYWRLPESFDPFADEPPPWAGLD